MTDYEKPDKRRRKTSDSLTVEIHVDAVCHGVEDAISIKKHALAEFSNYGPVTVTLEMNGAKFPV